MGGGTRDGGTWAVGWEESKILVYVRHCVVRCECFLEFDPLTVWRAVVGGLSSELVGDGRNDGER